jgi:hypothetical protein
MYNLAVDVVKCLKRIVYKEVAARIGVAANEYVREQMLYFISNNNVINPVIPQIQAVLFNRTYDV